MLSAIRQEARVQAGGGVEVISPDLQEGSLVEVIVVVHPPEVGTTEYLLSTQANRDHLHQALQDLERPDRRVSLEMTDLES